MKLRTIPLAALAAFTIAGPASAATLLFSDNFNSERVGAPVFNDSTALTADQSGTAVATETITYAIVHSGWYGAYQRGNGGTWLMHARGAFADENGPNMDSRGSLNYDIAAAAGAQPLGSQALQISFNMTVHSGVAMDDWTSFTVGTQNPFVNASTVGFGSLFRVNGGTQQFSNTTLDINDNASDIGGAPTFTQGALISFVFSDFTGSGSAFTNGDSTDIVKMYINGSLTNTFTGLNLGTDDQFISFNANRTEAQIDNLQISAIPEPGAALLGSLGMLALLRRRRA